MLITDNHKLYNNLIVGVFWAVLIFLITSCHQDESITVRQRWTKTLPTLGTFSSIRCADLNKDEVLDVIIGAGRNEFEESDSAVVAIDGTDGSILWTSPGTDQMVGTAVISDMNNDIIPDVIIGGRKTQLKVLDGRDGSKIWVFTVRDNDYNAKGYMRFNFFSPQLIKDQTGDKIPELLVTNGGNIMASSKDGLDRYPGVLGILDGATGHIIAVDTMPDGQETYMSPVVDTRHDPDNPKIFYGSGGETMRGHLYQTTLQDLMEGDISRSSILSSKEGHGFIAPVQLADINHDDHLDIIANWHGGEMMAIDGSNHKQLWSYQLGDTELNCSPTPGDATGDGIPDFFSSFTQGAWPESKGSIQVLIDGASGLPIYQDSSGCVGFSSALSYDLDDDGKTEFIYSINDHNCNGIYLGMTKYQLEYYNHATRRKEILYPPRSAKNIGSTPWIGDLDQDQHLDLITCIQANYNDIYSYYGLQISHLELDVGFSTTASCPEYMGLNGKGSFSIE